MEQSWLVTIGEEEKELVMEVDELLRKKLARGRENPAAGEGGEEGAEKEIGAEEGVVGAREEEDDELDAAEVLMRLGGVLEREEEQKMEEEDNEPPPSTPPHPKPKPKPKKKRPVDDVDEEVGEVLDEDGVIDFSFAGRKRKKSSKAAEAAKAAGGRSGR